MVSSLIIINRSLITVTFFLGEGLGQEAAGLVLEEQLHPALHLVQPAMAEAHQAHALFKGLDRLLQVQVAVLQGVQDFFQAL